MAGRARQAGIGADLKEQLDQPAPNWTRPSGRGDLAKAGELSYGVIPQLEKDLAAAEEQDEDVMVEEAVRPEQIAAVVERWTGIPTSKMLEGEREKLLRWKTSWASASSARPRPWAPSAAPCAARGRAAGRKPPARVVPVSRADRRRQDRADQGAGRIPLRRRQAMVRIDMSEFMEKHAVARLIGAPPGYVGYDEGGVLTEAVRRRPYQVILFDEVEKAHPEVFNVLLQVLDDGILTDGQGRTVDFKQTLIVLTSNLGAGAEPVARRGRCRAAKRDVMDAVRAHFRPEFLNRLDDMIVFDRLTATTWTGS
jgi:ATP-dependent Clp protease ATP-binding subunit ClpB